MKLTLHRRYGFAASHRLHSAHLTDEENRRVYGKCNNAYGHGHNYVIDVAVSGPVDPETGMIANLSDLDAFVQREVLDTLDHTYLNEDVAEFRSSVPTTENLSREIYRRLASFPHAKLDCVRIEETSLNSFEYSEENPGGLLA